MGEGGADVRQLRLDPVEPLALARAVHLGLRRMHEARDERELAVAHGALLVAEVAQKLRSVLANRLEHAETRLAVAAAEHEALVDERRECLEVRAAASSTASSAAPPLNTASRTRSAAPPARGAGSKTSRRSRSAPSTASSAVRPETSSRNPRAIAAATRVGSSIAASGTRTVPQGGRQARRRPPGRRDAAQPDGPARPPPEPGAASHRPPHRRDAAEPVDPPQLRHRGLLVSATWVSGSKAWDAKAWGKRAASTKAWSITPWSARAGADVL
jgi:hypothetical protein